MPRFLAHPSPRDQLEVLQWALNSRTGYGLNDPMYRKAMPIMQFPVQKAQLLIDVEKVNDSVTMDEDANGCYECEDEDKVCKYLQKEIENAAKLPPKAVLLKKACGGEGRVFIYHNSVVKAMPMSKYEHLERIKKCQMASQKQVGADYKNAWFSHFPFIVKHEEAEESRWTGWSCVQTEKLQPVQRTPSLLSKVKALVRKTALAGFLHTDTRIDNIMQTLQGDYRFVDWEASIDFTPRKGKSNVQSCQFCLLAEAFMLGKLRETLSDDNRPNFIGADQQDLINTFEAKVKVLKDAWGASVENQVNKFLKVIRADCSMKKDIGRVLDMSFGRDQDMKIEGCENAKK